MDSNPEVTRTDEDDRICYNCGHVISEHANDTGRCEHVNSSGIACRCLQFEDYR